MSKPTDDDKQKKQAKSRESETTGKENVIDYDEIVRKRMYDAKLKHDDDTQKSKDKRDKMPSQRVMKALNSDEVGDAVLLIELLKDKFIYDQSAGIWFYWNDHFWRHDIQNQIMSNFSILIELYGNEMGEQLMEEQKAIKKGQEDKAKRHKKYADKLSKRIDRLNVLQRRKNVLTLMRSGTKSLGYPGLSWDSNPMLLGCKNGVIDLRTGEHRPGQAGDYIKTVSPVEWQSLNAPRETWNNFLLDIQDEDVEVCKYLQRLLGYAITGLAIEHVYPILWGEHGRNGKTTMMEIIKHVFGNLALRTSAEFLMMQKYPRSCGPSAELMALRGARLVWCSEINENVYFSSGRIKELSGGDTIVARPPFGRTMIEFIPTYLLMLITNEKPRLPANDAALWSRIHLIPFPLSFVENPTEPYQRKVDKQLPKKLLAESSGILAWLVEGCLEWQKHGLNPPQKILDMTNQYRIDEDLIGNFIDECCEVETEVEVQSTKLYKAFKHWSLSCGHKPVSISRFGKDVKKRFETKKNNTVYYIGIRLKKEYENQIEEQ